jgi:hypothetical protein
MDTFLGKYSSAGEGSPPADQPSRLHDITFAILSVFYSIFSPGLVLLAPLALYLVFRRLYPDACEGLPDGRLLFLLFSCGLGYILVLPNAAGMAYEGRQMIPFTSLLVGGYFWSVFRGRRVWMKLRVKEGGASAQGNRAALHAGFLIISGVALLMFLVGFLFNNRYPSPWQIGSEGVDEVLFAEELGRLTTVYEPVFLLLGGIVPMDPDYADGANQLSPDIEYYAGSRLILCLDSPELLAADLITLSQKSTVRFSPVLISDQPENIAAVVSILERKGLVEDVPKIVAGIRGRIVLDLTPYWH